MSPSPNLGQKPNLGPAAWQRRALLLAGLTIAYNLVEGLVSMGFGWADDSMALFGFGADSFIEVASALLVLWKLQDLPMNEGGPPARWRWRRSPLVHPDVVSGQSPTSTSADLARERRAALGIGWLFQLLALGILGGSLWQLWAHRHPPTTVPGLIIALLSLACMAFLWRAKLRAARALDSATLAADAACSRACIQLSGVLFLGSLLFLVAPALWWVDGAAALGLALLIGREGLGMVRAARSEHFSGGCGCGHD